jgi:quercetin dioxygenase-like cupin family protein
VKPTINILVESDELTIVEGSSSIRGKVASPHVHREHTDAFYVLEGELTFEIGCERQTTMVGPGGFVAVPPNVAHAFSHDSDRPARWLTIHARDGGFARFMRGMRDGAKVDWDIAGVPSDGGLPASAAVVR